MRNAHCGFPAASDQRFDERPLLRILRTTRGGKQEARARHKPLLASSATPHVQQKLSAAQLPEHPPKPRSLPAPEGLAAGSPRPNSFRLPPPAPRAFWSPILPSRSAWHADRRKPRSLETTKPARIPGPANTATNSPCTKAAIPPPAATASKPAAPAAPTPD